MNKISKTTIKEIKQKTNNKDITDYDKLKLNLLLNAINDYNIAIEEINKNGLVIVTNRGATTAQNPAVKIKLDNAKLIFRLCADLINTNNEDDDFLKDLMLK